MSIPTVAQLFNPLTGVFGNGLVQTFAVSGTWTVPAGVTTARVRMWGAGGGAGGGGGGFSLRTIYGLTPGTIIPISVPPSPIFGSGGTTSFGTYVSATGGTAAATTGVGIGVGGDINTAGGAGGNTGAGGGGVGNLLGSGGAAGQAGASGGGATNATTAMGNMGAFGTGGSSITTSGAQIPPTSGLEGGFSIDLIGVGGGGAYAQDGINGGGGGYSGDGGFPGGGGGGNASGGRGAAGLLIVEW